MFIVFDFRTGILSLPVIFSTLSALISTNGTVFQDKNAEFAACGTD